VKGTDTNLSHSETGTETTKGSDTPLSSEQQAQLALDAALEKKALEPVLLDLREQASYTDYILLLSGRSDRHVQAVTDAVVEALAHRQRRPLGVEGQQQGQWTLIDFGDLVVHVFYHPMREFYDLEGLWCDAPRVTIEVPPESRAGQMY
jgi:ribosome-associated protein